MREQDPTIQIFGMIGLRRLLSIENEPPVQIVIDLGLVPRILELVQLGEAPKLQFEAAWCITNIASGEHDHVQLLVDRGAVEVLVKLLASQQADVVEQVIWALGNISGDNARVRDLVINAGAVEPISQIVDRLPPSSVYMRNASWTLANLCRGRPGPKFDAIKRAIPSLAKVLMENDSEEILTDVCWALSYLTDNGTDRIQAVLATGVTTRLI